MRIQKMLVALAGALVLVTGVSAEQAAPAPAAQAPRFVPPLRGEAELAMTRPAAKREKDTIVTTLKVKNLSKAPIAGLKLEEFWYDKAGDPVSGDTYRHRSPLQPNEVIEITLRTPVNPKMDRNQYKFSHANGTVKPTTVPKL